MSGQIPRTRPDDRAHRASGHQLPRQDSANLEKWSHDVIYVVESGTVAEIRKKVAQGLKTCPESLLRQSLKNEHYLRTPLMAAAASGDFSLFTTVMHAVDTAVEKNAGRIFSAPQLRARQLTMKDSMGMTLAMVAARGGMVPIVRAVLRRIADSEDPERLVDSDYLGNTVLLHAAAGGEGATFDAFVQAIEVAFPPGEVQEQLQMKSANGWNVLMHAARCANQLSLTTVISACRTNLSPSKVRDLVEDVDVNGMTFLTHATSSSAVQPTAAEKTNSIVRQRRTSAAQSTPTIQATSADPWTYDYTRARGSSTIGRFGAITEEEEEEEEGGDIETGGIATPAGRAQASGRFGSSTPQKRPSTLTVVAPGDDICADPPAGVKETTDPSLVVFKTAWTMVEEVLWKGQLRKQLKMKDTWGRNLLIHAVQSGRVQIFDAAFSAMREHILDSETNELMCVDEDDNITSMMEAALEQAPQGVVALVKRRDQELKKAIALDERASTIESKMQSFIPGKLIVIFQLLLPEVGGGGTGPLILLLSLTLIAPMLTWASTLVSRDKPVLQKDSRHSFMTNLLSAPAIFFWGLGTSDIGTVSLGWTETASAAALAVATIVIPILDAFFANQRVEQWFDKWSGQSSTFSRKVSNRRCSEQHLAHRAWVLETRKLKGQKQTRGGPGDDQNPPGSKKCACDGLCRNLDAASVAEAATAASVAEAATGAHSSKQPSIGEGNNAATRAMAGATEEKEGLLDDVDEQAYDMTAMAPAWGRGPVQGLSGDGSSPVTGAMHAKDRMLPTMADKQRQGLTEDARSSAATDASEALLSSGGKDAVTAAMQKKDRMAAMAEEERQRLTDMTAGATSSVAAASKALLGDGKDAATEANREKETLLPMAEKQGQQLAAGARSSITAASHSLLGEGEDVATAAMQEKDRTFAIMAEKQGQQLAAGVRSSATSASQSLLAEGKDAATAAMQEKDRMFAIMAEKQGQGMMSGALSSATAASEALLSVGKDAVTAAMQEKDTMFAMVEKERQDLADRAAVTRSSVTAASEAFLSDGGYSPAGAMEEKQSMLDPDEKH